MQQTKNRSKKRAPQTKKYVLFAAAAVVVVAALLAVSEATNLTHFLHKASTYTTSDTKYNQQKKETVINQDGTPANDAANSKGDTTTPYTPPTTSNGITLTASQDGSQVTVTTKLSGYSDGTCTLTATNSDKTTTQTAQVIYAPDFSTCAGFSVSTATLGAGTWTISLSITSGGTTTTKDTTLEVH